VSPPAPRRAWCHRRSRQGVFAGHDLKEMRAEPSMARHENLFVQCTQMMRTIQKLPQPALAHWPPGPNHMPA
jgi:enoyl-CoA hydratase/carnithine racemase